MIPVFPSVVGILGRVFRRLDWLLCIAAAALIAAGLLTMNSFEGQNYFFQHQVVWVGISVSVFLLLAALDYRFLRRTSVSVALYVSVMVLLVALFTLGETIKGAQSWFSLGLVSFQPSDPAKLVLILVLAKYFSRRHVEIANIRHIVVSGLYAGVLTGFVLIQPDFGSAVILAFIWFGMVLVSGISKKHLGGVFLLSITAGSILWFYVFEPYQKQRILTFFYPLQDIHGAGYNAYQSMVAVGSGGLWGKGVGYGTQSKLQFLPEYETDFIFAAFAEEWGFFGVLLLLLCFGVLFWRIIRQARRGDSFESLFAMGVATYFIGHIAIHVGMNMGLLPVTGVTLPFLSYGGSHLVTECAALGILMSMRRHAGTAPRPTLSQELAGV